MRRMFQDITGKMKVLEFVGPGKKMKWRESLPAGSSTVWYDPETKNNHTIPDDSWAVLQIHFVDIDNEGAALEKA